MLISQTTPDNHPPTPPPCRWPPLITSPTLAKLQLVSRRLCDVVLIRSSCVFEYTLTAACALPECHSCRKYNGYSNILRPSKNVLHIFDQTDLYRFEVRLELYCANARLVVSPPCLSPSHPAMPLPSRWPALTTLPLLAKFQLVWCSLCEALLSSSSLAGPKHPSLLSRPCLKCRTYKDRFALNMNMKSHIIFSDTVDALTATFAV